MNPYEILGVEENATQEEIKNAYRERSKKHHPDVGGDSKEFLKIQKAYEILTNKEKRNYYDLYGVDIDFMTEAKELAFALFMDISQQVPDGVPVDRELHNFIAMNEIPKFEQEMKDIENKKIKLQARLLHIVKKPDDDFITEGAQVIITRYETDYKVALLKRDLHKKALELLDGYQFDRIQISNNMTYGDVVNSPMPMNIFMDMMNNHTSPLRNWRMT